MIFKVVKFTGNDKRVKSSFKDSIKKLKYLKNPKIPMFTVTDAINKAFRVEFLFEFFNNNPIRKSTVELTAIKERNL